jgi:hypothetical protein
MYGLQGVSLDPLWINGNALFPYPCPINHFWIFKSQEPWHEHSTRVLNFVLHVTQKKKKKKKDAGLRVMNIPARLKILCQRVVLFLNLVTKQKMLLVHIGNSSQKLQFLRRSYQAGWRSGNYLLCYWCWDSTLITWRPLASEFSLIHNYSLILLSDAI